MEAIFPRESLRARSRPEVSELSRSPGAGGFEAWIAQAREEPSPPSPLEHAEPTSDGIRPPSRGEKEPRSDPPGDAAAGAPAPRSGALEKSAREEESAGGSLEEAPRAGEIPPPRGAEPALAAAQPERGTSPAERDGTASGVRCARPSPRVPPVLPGEAPERGEEGAPSARHTALPASPEPQTELPARRPAGAAKGSALPQGAPEDQGTAPRTAGPHPGQTEQAAASGAPRPSAAASLPAGAPLPQGGESGADAPSPRSVRPSADPNTSREIPSRAEGISARTNPSAELAGRLARPAPPDLGRTVAAPQGFSRIGGSEALPSADDPGGTAGAPRAHPEGTGSLRTGHAGRQAQAGGQDSERAESEWRNSPLPVVPRAPSAQAPARRVNGSGAPRSPSEPPALSLRVAAGLERHLAAKAREFLARGRTEVRLTLEPPRLGRLRIRLHVSEHRTSARIVATSQETAALLSRERGELARAFREQGIEDVSVQVESEDRSQAEGRSRGDPARDIDPEAPPRDVPSKRPPARPAVLRAQGAGIDLFV